MHVSTRPSWELVLVFVVGKETVRTVVDVSEQVSRYRGPTSWAPTLSSRSTGDVLPSTRRPSLVEKYSEGFRLTEVKRRGEVGHTRLGDGVPVVRDGGRRVLVEEGNGERRKVGLLRVVREGVPVSETGAGSTRVVGRQTLAPTLVGAGETLRRKSGRLTPRLGTRLGPPRSLRPPPAAVQPYGPGEEGPVGAQVPVVET